MRKAKDVTAELWAFSLKCPVLQTHLQQRNWHFMCSADGVLQHWPAHMCSWADLAHRCPDLDLLKILTPRFPPLGSVTWLCCFSSDNRYTGLTTALTKVITLTSNSYLAGTHSFLVLISSLISCFVIHVSSLHHSEFWVLLRRVGKSLRVGEWCCNKYINKAKNWK